MVVDMGRKSLSVSFTTAKIIPKQPMPKASLPWEEAAFLALGQDEKMSSLPEYL